MNRIIVNVLKTKRIFNSFHMAAKINCRRSQSTSNVKTTTKEKKLPPSSPSFKLPPKLAERKQQKFDYFLVLDFEATCDAPVNVVPQEIIEFPVLKINGKTFETESSFQSYVQPKVNKEITPFCTELTGIIQEMIDDQPQFEEVLEKFQLWLTEEGLLKSDVKFTFVTCGDWDLRYMFQIQCKGCRLPIPPYMKNWINIKLSFSEMAQTWPRNLLTMLKYCEQQHEGRLHSGIDDCKNIAKILKDLADRGIVYDCNGSSQ